jgi:ABC-type multidrug transport system ATPase subunit
VPTVDPVPTSRSTPVGQLTTQHGLPLAPAARPVTPAPRPLGAQGVVRVGHAIDNDIAIADPALASYHLDAWLGPQGLVIRDLSGGRTTVNGQTVVEGTVHPEATISLGGFLLPARALLERASAAAVPAPQPRPVPELEHLLIARGVVRQIGDRTILRGVDFTVRRGQFIAVAGASGAGKSTLMSVLNGYVAPDDGTVEVVRNADGEPDLGYVPQDDIIHRALTLREAVVMSAALRFAPGTPMEQIERRADEVLTELGLREHAGTRVDRLSGGQRKRASVALELMTRPRLLLLDEPTSGLDPASDRRLIAMLGALADSGYGVVLITHTTTNIDACDTVAFLAPGGHLVFWGSPQEAREYFGCPNLEEVYERLEDTRFGTPEQWRQRFEASPAATALREEVAAGLQEFAELHRITAANAAPAQLAPFGAAPAAAAAPRKPGLTSWQLKGLARRYLRTLLADRRTLLIMLAQAPAIVVLARILFPGDALTANPTNPADPLYSTQDVPTAAQTLSDHAGKGVQLLFLLGCTLVWLGIINAAREICKEIPIWQRERHAGVRPAPYLLSKFLVLGGLCLAQVVLWLVLIAVLFGFPDGGGFFGFFCVGVATAISGVAVGLVISAAMPNPDRAMTVVPLVMIPQLLFSGAIISLAEMGGFGQAVSALFSGRWAFEGLGRLVDPTDRFIDVQTGGPSSTISDRGFDGSAAGPFFALLLLTLAFGAIAAWLVSTRGLPRGSHQSRLRAQSGAPMRWQPPAQQR